jgi:hypothetical protein
MKRVVSATGLRQDSLFRNHFRSDGLGTGLWIIGWTRSLDANRNAFRSKML